MEVETVDTEVTTVAEDLTTMAGEPEITHDLAKEEVTNREVTMAFSRNLSSFMIARDNII